MSRPQSPDFTRKTIHIRSNYVHYSSHGIYLEDIGLYFNLLQIIIHVSCIYIVHVSWSMICGILVPVHCVYITSPP